MNYDVNDIIDSEERISIDDFPNIDKTIESLKKGAYTHRRVLGKTFHCEYCDKTRPINELRYSSENNSTYALKSGFLGRGYIEKFTSTHSTIRCKRCTIIHYIVGCFHFFLGLVCIGLLCYPTWKNHTYFNYENYLMPAVAGGFIAYLISRIDWLIIKWTLGVRRKP